MHVQPRLRPTFLIIGAQKGGTTALFEYLSTHPNIAAPDAKELNFFLGSALHAHGLDFYHSHFPRRDPAQPDLHTFEASPNYLSCAEAAQRIHAYDPNMRLIALLRDPVDRAFSAWQMYCRFSHLNPNWFSHWMKSCNPEIDLDQFTLRGSFGDSFEDDIRTEMDLIAEGKQIAMPILRHGLYAKHLRNYYRYFTRDQILVETREQFREETAVVLGEIEAFVGLPRHEWDQTTLAPIFVGQYEPPTRSTIELLQQFYQQPNQDLCQLLGRNLPWK